MTFSTLKRAAAWAAIALVVALGLASCLPPGLMTATGTLVVTIDGSATGARTLVPNIDMNVASYVVSGTGPGGSTFSVTITGTTTTIPSLTTGTWTVNADGKNAAGTFIGHGSSSVKVTGGGSVQNVSLVVSPIAGLGTLSLSLTWPAAQVTAPVISAQLLPATGSAIALAFTTPVSGASSFTSSSILNGYYTLVLQLLDGTQLAAGAVDVVRIVAGQTTSGTFAFTNITQSKGSISVNITPQLQDPLSVTLAGLPAAAAVGTPFTATASVPAGSGTVTYVWYVNGVSTATGASLTLNAAATPLAAGTYRIDVIAFTTDGLRAGSATGTVTVSTTSSVTLAWNPNTETNLASYKLYLGTSSGTYTASANVGLVTTYTISGLASGQTYYAAVSALNTSSMESAKSAEISFTAP